jgi:hypothetical protein
MPLVNIFIDFWETNIIIETQYNEDNEFEIDELCTLFKKWNNKNKGNNANISEHSVLKIIEHYYQNVEIVDNKYILNIKCKLWDKWSDIENALINLKNNSEIDKCSLLSFDDAYDFYFNFCNKKINSDTKYVVSKRFFEKYIYSNLSNYIEFEKFISISWFHS